MTLRNICYSYIKLQNCTACNSVNPGVNVSIEMAVYMSYIYFDYSRGALNDLPDGGKVLTLSLTNRHQTLSDRLTVRFFMQC